MKAMSQFGALLLLALAICLTACNRRTPLPPGAVVFDGAGVALVPGEHWKELRSGPDTEEHLICLPVLMGDGEWTGVRIQVFSSPTDKSSPEKRAASLRAHVDLLPEAIKDSFKQENFTTEAGLAGVHVNYDLAIEVKGRKIMSRNHDYIVQNALDASVVVSVSAVASPDLEPVHQMLRKTLRLK